MKAHEFCIAMGNQGKKYYNHSGVKFQDLAVKMRGKPELQNIRRT